MVHSEVVGALEALQSRPMSWNRDHDIYIYILYIEKTLSHFCSQAKPPIQ